MHKVPRLLEEQVLASLKAFPAVYIAGPRQSGKTTLVKHIAKNRHKASYVSFDDVQLREAAQHSPEDFLRSFKGPVVLDEIQLAPSLFRVLKIIIDENREQENGGRGHFLLTGSASVMSLPKLADALVGRMALHQLLPFSAAELSFNNKNDFIHKAFSGEWSFANMATANMLDIWAQASFPELRNLTNDPSKYQWCNAYLNTILQRDVRLLIEIEKIGSLPNMLALIAANSGGLLNEAALARDLNLNHLTIKKYRILLESLFLTLSVPAWSANIGKRLIKSPKVYISDLNLWAYLLGIDLAKISQYKNPKLLGQLFENFVAIELSKQLSFSKVHAKLYHYRDTTNAEVDFLLEGPQAKIVAIEVKANHNATINDFKHLKMLKANLGDRLHAGFVVYQGQNIVSFGDRLWAIPFSSLWQELA